ncbi:MAG: hypothetical protein FJ290_21145 [Planctomycetes bacterium]|nr:hypothetical protein [Planctomycetota bacterium]
MARRDTEPPVSLFPFLSVLASVMAALILALCGAVVGQVGTREAADKGDTGAKARAEEAVALKEKVHLTEEEKKKLEKLLAKAMETAILVEKLKSEADRLQKAVDLSKKDVAEQTKLLEQLARLRELIEAAKRRLQELLATIEQLKNEIAKAEAARKEKVKELEAKRTAFVRFRGRPGLHPSFIECRRDDIILHPEGTSVPTVRIASSDEVKALITRIQQNRDRGWTAVLLVRPDGVRTHDLVMALLREADVPRGALPVLGHEKLDPSTFPKSP